MSKKVTLSPQTRRNWLIDAALFVSALLAAISGIYFLFLPSGGYRGGRNPYYNITILFNRQTWDDLHAWAGVAMIAGVVIHFIIHWRWVVTMTKRTTNMLLGRQCSLSRGSLFNVAIDALVAVGFVATAVSGFYFLFFPEGSRNATTFLFSRTTWDLIHTWGFVGLFSAAIVHFAIHWRWITNVTSRFFLSLWQRGAAQPFTVTAPTE